MGNPEPGPVDTGDGGSDDYRPPKEEPKSEPDGGDGEADDDDGPPQVDDYRDHGSHEEDPESKVIDVYHHPVKEEPEVEFGDGDGDAVDVNGRYDRDPPKEEPELVAADDETDDDGSRDVGYDCSHCGISLSSREFQVEHTLICKAQMQRRRQKRPIVKRRDFKGTYFDCDKCEYVSKWKNNLEKHYLKHNKENCELFTCTQCSYKTVCKQNFSQHTKLHGHTFSCCCPICGKSFGVKQNLHDHLLKLHSDESDKISKLITSKIYTCNICDKYRTTLKAGLNRHLSVKHLKGVGCQKYECARCPYSTFTKGNLRQHLISHTGQKDYQCALCKNQFTRKAHLHSHILCVHADNVDLVKTITTKMHHCESCSFKSVETTRLKNHVRSKHI